MHIYLEKKRISLLCFIFAGFIAIASVTNAFTSPVQDHAQEEHEILTASDFSLQKSITSPNNTKDDDFNKKKLNKVDNLGDEHIQHMIDHGYTELESDPGKFNAVNTNNNLKLPNENREMERKGFLWRFFRRVLRVVLFIKNMGGTNRAENNDTNNARLIEQEKLSIKQLNESIFNTEKRINRLSRQRYKAEHYYVKKLLLDLKLGQLDETTQRLETKKMNISKQISILDTKQNLYTYKKQFTEPTKVREGIGILKKPKSGEIISDEIVTDKSKTYKKELNRGSPRNVVREENMPGSLKSKTINKYGYIVVKIDDLLKDDLGYSLEKIERISEETYEKPFQKITKSLTTSNLELSKETMKKPNQLQQGKYELLTEKTYAVNEKSTDTDSMDTNYINEFGVNVWKTTQEPGKILNISDKTKNQIQKMIADGRTDEIVNIASENDNVKKVIRRLIQKNIKKKDLALNEKDRINEYISILGKIGTEDDIKFLNDINDINRNPNDYYVYNICLSIWKLKKQLGHKKIESQNDFNDAKDYINYIYNYYQMNHNENMTLYNFEIEFLSEIVDALRRSDYKQEAIPVIEKLMHFKNADFTNHVKEIINEIGLELDKDNSDKVLSDGKYNR